MADMLPGTTHSHPHSRRTVYPYPCLPSCDYTPQIRSSPVRRLTMTDDIGRQVDDAIREQLTGRTAVTSKPSKTRSDLTTVVLALVTLAVCAAVFGLLWRVFAFAAGIGG